PIAAYGAKQGDNASVVRQLLREARSLCESKCENLAEFAEVEAKIGDVEASRKSFDAAWNAATHLEVDSERRLVLSGIAELRVTSGQLKEAVQAARRLSSSADHAFVLGTIANAEAEVGDAKSALEIVDLIPTEELSER